MGELKQLTKSKVLRTVLPGDSIDEININESKKKIYLGPGLKYVGEQVVARNAGLLKLEQNNLYYVDTMQKRYIPRQKEFVIGIVTKKKGENYLIDIGGHEGATLSYLSFENASKKTRKELQSGDLVYAQLLVANKDMEPELVCIDVFNRSAGMGNLPEGGILFNVPLHVARQIVDPHNPFLLKIANKVTYSIVVGFNGRVYVRTRSHKDMLAVMHSVYLLETMGLKQALSKIDSVIEKFLTE